MKPLQSSGIKMFRKTTMMRTNNLIKKGIFTMKLDIVAIPKPLLLLQLYNNALYQNPRFDLVPTIRQKVAGKSNGTFIVAHYLIKGKQDSHKYRFTEVDLGAGHRDLNVDLTNFEVDFTQYDDLHGKGTAFKVIKELRESIASQSEILEDDTEDNFLTKVIVSVNQKMLEGMMSPDEAKTLLEQTNPIIPDDDALMLSKLAANRQLLENYFVDPAINKDAESKAFLNDLKNILDTNNITKKYKEKGTIEFYIAWLYFIDPSIVMSDNYKYSLTTTIFTHC